MLPYLDLPKLGPITSFGILASIGMYCAIAAATRHAARLGIDPKLVSRMALYCGVGTILGAHYVDLFFYQPGWSDQPDAFWRFVNPNAGISSYGGILGATLGFLLFARKHDQRLRLGDVAAIGGLVMLTIGRAGCASVHDHVGVASDFALAVDFPAGNPAGVVGPHHDLGLYEFAMLAVLLGVSLVLLRTPRRPGWFVGFLAVTYPVPRFLLETLRREGPDPRYAGLTPAQWGCLATFAAGLAVLAVVHRRGEAPPKYLDRRVHRRMLRRT